jgi:hypothetical protein
MESNLTPTLLANAVKDVLMAKPNKSVIFKSFATQMGKDFIPFINHCQKQVDAVKERRIAELEKELKELKGI